MPALPAWPPAGRGVPHTYTLFCPPLPTAPRIARDYIATVLRSLDLHQLADAAALCTSELVTNAYRHSDGCGSLLRLTVEAGDVRVAVYDAASEKPVERAVDDDAECGRGLRLVDVITGGRWGTEPGAPPWLGGADGKGVWFTLSANGATSDAHPGWSD